MLSRIKWRGRVCRDVVAAAWYRALTSRYRIAGHYRRIYHYHIRKTAGTSLNSAFMALAGETWKGVVGKINQSGSPRTCAKGLVFVSHHPALIRQGYYFFAHSHTPAHELEIPEKTFTLTILRDPVKRLASHYRSLLWYRQHNPARPILREEGSWLGNSFGDFLQRTPREHRDRQLYMFSAGYDVDEALAGICKCSAVLFTETFGDGMVELADQLSLPLEEKHDRRMNHTTEISDADLSAAREILDPEYRLLDGVRREARVLGQERASVSTRADAGSPPAGTE